jgi:hypothetical protein
MAVFLVEVDAKVVGIVDVAGGAVVGAIGEVANVVERRLRLVLELVLPREALEVLPWEDTKLLSHVNVGGCWYCTC